MKCDYFLDFAYSHQKTIRNLIDKLKCNTMQYNAIQYNTIQYNTIQYNTIQYNKIQKTNAIYLRNWQIMKISVCVTLSLIFSLILMVHQSQGFKSYKTKKLKFPGLSLVDG